MAEKEDSYIAQERRKSTIIDTGVQYIPGHLDEFADYIVQHYLPKDKEILDLGGGGLLFATKVATCKKYITVVDLDIHGLDKRSILERVKKTNKIHIERRSIESYIHTKVEDVFDFLTNTNLSFGLVTALRLVHFFNRKRLDRFFSLVRSKLEPDGIFAISAITPYDFSCHYGYNEFFLNSYPVDNSNNLCRRFYDSPKAEALRKQQNLPSWIYMVDSDFIRDKAHEYSFEVVESCFKSTRVVEGYVLRVKGYGTCQ